jgi:purine-binding chemotaxis protein CheW
MSNPASVPRKTTATAESKTVSLESFAESLLASLASKERARTRESRHAPKLPFRERARLRTGIAELLVFRVGPELFAVELTSAEEALDMPAMHRLPEMPATMLGVFTLRESLVSVFSPHEALGISFNNAATVVVFRGAERRFALATDDVDDVLTVDLATLRDAPGAERADSCLLGVVHRGAELIGVLDAESIGAVYRAAAAAIPVEGVKENV